MRFRGHAARSGSAAVDPKGAFEHPLLPYVLGGRQRRVGAGRGASLERSSAERADCPAVLGLAAASPNSLRSLCALFAQTVAMRMLTNALRWPQALCSSAPQKARRDRPPHAFAAGLLVCGLSEPGLPSVRANQRPGSGLVLRHCERELARGPYGNVAIQDLTPAPAPGAPHTKDPASRQAGPGGGDLWGAEEHSGRGGARSALRKHSHRTCLNEEPAGRVVSCAMRPCREHRRAVCAFSARPLHREPAPGPACRDARQRHGNPTTQPGKRPPASG